MNYKLNTGAISAIVNNQGPVQSPIVQVLNCKLVQPSGENRTEKERYSMVISDGTCYHRAMLATQLNSLVKEGHLSDNSVIQLDEFICNQVHNKKIIIVLKLTIKGKTNAPLGNPIPLDGPAPQDITNVPPRNVNPSSNQPPIQQRPPVQPINPQPQRQQGQPQGQQAFRGQQQMQQNNNSNNNPRQAYQNQNQNPNANSSQDLSNIFPIKTLNPYQKRWTIKARVTQKSDLRPWSSQSNGKSGQLFSIDLLDTSGEIRATLFNEAATKWFETIQVDKVFAISGGTLKPANRKFTTIKNEYELTLNEYTTITECQDELELPKQNFNFVSIGKIDGYEKDTMIDICAIVHNSGTSANIITKAQKALTKRDVILVDSTMKAITLTLWGNNAESPPWAEHEHPVVAIKSIKVSDYNGRTLTTVSSSNIIVNPDIPDTNRLLHWYNANSNAQFESLSQSTWTPGDSEGGNTSSANADTRTLGEIKKIIMQSGNTKGQSFKLKGTVTRIKAENFSYSACTSCKKKVSGDPINGYFCAKCQQTFPACNQRYIVSMCVADHSGTQWVTVFDDTAKQILGPYDPETLNQMGLNNPADVKKIFSEAQSKDFNLTVRANMHTHTDDTPKLRCSVLAANPLDYIHESRVLFDLISQVTYGN